MVATAGGAPARDGDVGAGGAAAPLASGFFLGRPRFFGASPSSGTFLGRPRFFGAVSTATAGPSSSPSSPADSASRRPAASLDLRGAAAMSIVWPRGGF